MSTSRPTAIDAAARAFSVTMHRYGPLTVMTVAGELDMDTARLLTDLAGEALDAGQSFPVLVVDMSAVTFFSAAGIRALLELRQALAGAAGHLMLRAPSPVTHDVLAAVDALDYFRIDDAPPKRR